MSRRGKKITFVILDIFILGFLGLYLSFNLNYDEDNPTSGDFTLRMLDNNTTDSCTGANQITKSDGTCGTCTNDNIPNSSHTACYCPKPDKASVSSNGCSGKYSKGGQGCAISFSGSGTVECSSNDSTISVSNKNGACNVSVTGDLPKGTCEKSVSVSATNTNKCGETSDSVSASLTVYVPWGDGQAGAKVYSEATTKINKGVAEAKSYNTAYEGCSKVSDYWTCTKYSRPCGKSVPNPEPKCYKNNSDGFLYWGVYSTINNDGDEVTKQGYTLVNNVDRDSCYTQFKCSRKNPDARTVTNECNGTHVPVAEVNSNNSELTGEYVKKCGVFDGTTISDDFYKITCQEKMKTAYNGPIFDDNNSFMYPGTGFKFNYEAKTIVDCKGEWHEDFYNKASKYVDSYLNAKKAKAFRQEDNSFYDSAKQGLADIRNSYITWRLNYFGAPGIAGTISDSQPTIPDKVIKKDERSFNLELVSGYDVATKTCGSEPTSAKNFNYTVTYDIKMQMPVVYYNQNSKDMYSTTSCTGCAKLGRIFPISDIKDYAGNTAYSYNVAINNLGMGHNWTNNESCGLKVKAKEIVFRPINLSDPFIQQLSSDHKIGLNWKNSVFDFTGIIDKEIWSKPSEYNKVTINEEVGSLIKKELANQYASYLGSCSKGTDQSKTPQLCNLYKQAVAGK